MNYIILKSIIDVTIQNFRCKNCNSWVGEWNINILGTAGNTLNLEIICPNCKTQWIVKAEIWMMWANQNPDFVSNVKNVLQNPDNSKDQIKDDDIVKLRKDLNNCSSLEDLFK